MAKRIHMTRRGGMLVPATEADREQLMLLPGNKVLGVDVVVSRNYEVHKRAFALVQLAFDLWQPENFVTAVERATVKSLYGFLVRHGLNAETVKALCHEFLRALDGKRQGMAADKSFEGFREFITIEAGHYNTVITPAGPRRVAKSWSYRSQDDAEFRQFYRDLFNACWRLVLSQHFDSEDEAESAAEQLLTFDT